MHLEIARRAVRFGLVATMLQNAGTRESHFRACPGTDPRVVALLSQASARTETEWTSGKAMAHKVQLRVPRRGSLDSV